MNWLRKPPLTHILGGVAAAWLLAVIPLAPAHAIWSEYAMVSATMGVSDSRICIGEASRGDLGCPSYAPTVSATGTLNVTGGLVTDSVSLTTAGTTWGYLGSGASYIPNLSSNAISASSLTVNGVSVTGAGASKLASLTDVSASSPANNSLLRYNSSTSKWEAVGLNTAVSTTTMVAGWPDAIKCTASTGATAIFYLDWKTNSADVLYSTPYDSSANAERIQFTSAGAFSAQNISNGWTVTDCNKSISQLYTDGQAFNFIGNNGTSVSSSTASGYTLTSGTLSVTANSATGVVSLTTGGTTWGYLGSAASYLPSLTAAQVSSTAISTTAVQIASVTTVTACSATNAGTLRYNSGNTALELCTGSGWQPMGVGIPAGTISAFASTTCPTGWSEYTPARGRFLRGIDNGAGNDPSGTRVPGATQADALANHNHFTGLGFDNQGNFYGAANGSGDPYYGSRVLNYGTRYHSGGGAIESAQIRENLSDGVANTLGSETRPKNVAVTYCQFNGTSNGWNNPLSGGSTSAAGSTGYIQYNTSGSFDANSGLTWTNASQRLTATNISATALTVNGVAITGSASGDRVTSGTTSLIANTSGTLDANAPLNVSGTVAASGVSTTGPVSTSAVHFQDNPSEACTTGNIGAMKVISGRVYTCRM